MAGVALLAGAGAATGGGTNAVLFSEDSALTRFQIELSPEAVASLGRDPRGHVAATVREGTNVLRDVAVRLKGRKGSFRKLEDKPALTLDFDRLVPGQTFCGLTKLHLNNSVEDPSFLHEWIGTELFLAAGVPAPRVGHALVEVNGRRLGLYVAKEGFAPEFLARHFARSDGEMFEPEPGTGADVNGSMGRLAEVIARQDAELRWQQLPAALDVERFTSFLALEILIGHRDGYALAKNNYRVYHDPATERRVFLPAGMDQLFGRTRTSLWPHPAGLVARALMESSAGRRALHERMQMLFTNVLRAEALTNEVRHRAARLAPQLTRPEARALMREADDLCERIALRVRVVEEELRRPPPGPLEFRKGVAMLRDWRATGAPEKGRMERLVVEGRSTLFVRAGLRTSAAWRTKIWLPPGRYRFEALARLKGVQAVAGVRHAGVCLSAPGRGAREVAGVAGDREWSVLATEFEVATEDREVELICHVRASAGEAWFDESSLRLVRLP